MDVSVLIVTWNSGKYIRNCLESIYSNTKTCTFEVVVVDNGSADDTVEIVRKDFPDVRLYEAGVNLGFARGSNAAMRLARGDYFFLINPDTSFMNDVIGEVVKFFESKPDAGAAGPKMLEKDGSLIFYQVREFPSVSERLFIHLGLRKLFPKSSLFSHEYIPGWDRNSLRAVPYMAGAAIMIPRKVIADVGYLDEGLPMYFEDLDICARIGESGKSIYYVPDAVIMHLGGMSSKLFPVQPLLYALEKGQAEWLFFLRHRTMLHAGAFTLMTFLGSCFRLAALSLLLPFAGLLGGETALRIRRQLSMAAALFVWSVSRKEGFVERLKGFFPETSACEAIEAAFTDGN